MKSALEYDKKIKEEFGVVDDFELEQVHKLAFVRVQYDEIKKMIWRDRVDLILSEKQLEYWTKKEVESAISESRAKVSNYRNMIRGYVLSLTVLDEIIKTLESQV